MTPPKLTTRRPALASTTPQRTLAQTPLKKPPPNSNASPSTPISDYPSPPYQIVSCRHAQQGELIALPLLSMAPSGEIPHLALQKLKQCLRQCDFSDVKSDAVSKETKKGALTELIELYSNTKLISRLTRDCHNTLIEVFCTNVFRPSPNIPRALLFSDEVTFEDSAWPHLSLIYILFLKFLDAPIDPRILQYQLTPRFVVQLFAVLDFPDDRERNQAKAVIGALFAKAPPQRPLLRSLATSLLQSAPGGAGHLLDLLYLFTAGVPPPLAPAVVTSFEKTVLPLHLATQLPAFHPQLLKFCLLIIRKEPRLLGETLQFLACHWPQAHDRKCELFIAEAQTLLDETIPQGIRHVMLQLVSRVASAAESPSSSLAEKAIRFLCGESVTRAIKEDSERILSIIVPALLRVARGHWSRSVQAAAISAVNSSMEADPDAFSKVIEEIARSSKEKNFQKERADFWNNIGSIAEEKCPGIGGKNVGNYFL